DIIAKGNAFSHEYARQIVDSGLASSDPAALNLLAQFKNSLITIGASGAVFGLLLGFAFIFPNQPMYLFFIPIPIKAKYMVIGYGVIEFFLGVGNVGSVAHFAHLGGLLFALIILLYWKKKGTLHGGGYY
ncbi:MAG: rhomboid family intramembrane serine protease, partial [Muribaculaceae bacterium]|nr:rhomboid family intramembrane serine protease [Muribaculaceae bacterium]